MDSEDFLDVFAVLCVFCSELSFLRNFIKLVCIPDPPLVLKFVLFHIKNYKLNQYNYHLLFFSIIFIFLSLSYSLYSPFFTNITSYLWYKAMRNQKTLIFIVSRINRIFFLSMKNIWCMKTFDWIDLNKKSYEHILEYFIISSFTSSLWNQSQVHQESLPLSAIWPNLKFIPQLVKQMLIMLFYPILKLIGSSFHIPSMNSRWKIWFWWFNFFNFQAKIYSWHSFRFGT